MLLKPRLPLHVVVCRLPPAPRGGTCHHRRPQEEGSRRQGAATVFFLVLNYVRHGRRCCLRLDTHHQPPRSGNVSTKRLPIGEHRVGHYVLQLRHLA
jgi:hypothetical protein